MPVQLQQHEEPEARYDLATAQRVMADASRLQDEHRDSLTREQMEAIGAEVGLDPLFVRKALLQIETQGAAPQATIATPVAATGKTRRVLRRESRTNTAKGIRAWLPQRSGPYWTAINYMLYTYALFLVENLTRHYDSVQMLLITIAVATLLLLPPLLSLKGGWRYGSRRQGAVGGLVIGLGIVVGAVAFLKLGLRDSASTIPWQEFFDFLVLPSIVSGILGGELSRWHVKPIPAEPGIAATVVEPAPIPTPLATPLPSPTYTPPAPRPTPTVAPPPPVPTRPWWQDRDVDIS